MSSSRASRKKGNLAMDTVLYIPRLIFFVFVAITVVFLIRTYVTYSIDVGDAEIEVQANRLVYSPLCLAYHDEVLDRSFPGIVDLDKFTPVQLDRCMRYGDWNDYIAMELVLRPLDDPEAIIAEVVYNAQGRDAWIPRVGKPGPGGASVRRVRYVVYRDDDTGLKPAILDILAVMPNT